MEDVVVPVDQRVKKKKKESGKIYKYMDFAKMP